MPIFCAVKFSDEVESVSGDVPVPERLTTCGLVTALSLIAICPVRRPPIVGPNCTCRLQEAPEASEVGGGAHKFVPVVVVAWLKLPLNWKLLMLSGVAELLFVMVIV